MITKEKSVTDVYTQPEIEGGTAYRQALEVQDFVNASLTYTRKSRLEQLENPQSVRRTNCIGFSLVGSQWLQDTGIEHYVAVANGHTTTLVVDEGPEGKNIWLMDMLSPQLNQNMSGVISPEDLEKATPGPDQPGRAILAIYGDRIARNMTNPSLYDQDTVFLRHPWLTVNGSTSNPKTKLIWSLFNPETAQAFLPHYARFHDATVGEKSEDYDLETASQAILELAGIFPDADIRGDSPKIVKNVVKKLAMAGDVGKAEAVTASFFSSFDFSRDTRVSEYRADCLRSIAKLSGAAGFIRRKFLQEALDLYDEISVGPYASTSIAGKIAACNSLEIGLVDEAVEAAQPKSGLQYER